MSKKKLSIFTVTVLIIVAIFIISRGETSVAEDTVDLSTLSENEIQTIEEADDIMEGTYVVSVSENDIDYTFQYTGDVFEVGDVNNSVQRKIYNFQLLQPLRSAYKITGDKKYIEKGMEYIRDFTEQAPFDTDQMTWHDETTSSRLNNYFGFYEDGYDVLSSSDRELVEEEMKFIAEKIAYTGFYSGSNNHGMYQDNAMLQYAIEFNDTEMIEIGSERLEDYFISHFDKDGVHLENSPEYHFHMVESLKSILDRYNENVLPSYGGLETIYEKSVNYANMVVLPNGIIPNVGDSLNMEINLEEYYNPDLIEASQSSGRATFYESGYDIVKNDDTYLLFRAGYLKDYHHHNDDLSFWLYKDGNIFTEVGSYGYDSSVSYTDYAKTFNAHNTLVVDGENEADTKDVHLLESDHSNVMSGETNRIIGTNFKRNIHFNDELTEFTISDQIRSEDSQNHNYELLFHLDPSISTNVIAQENYNTVELIRDEEKIGEFVTKESVYIDEDVHFPYYYAEPQETDVIVVEKTGNNEDISSKIILD